MKNNRICIFAGSNTGAEPAYVNAAKDLGAELSRRGIGLVYGGAKIGLMGAVAEAALAGGGEVTGVVPNFLVEKDLAHERLSNLYIVNSMHERKTMMSQLADGFVALPGGLGTFEEILEALTWAQLGLHEKPCALLNVHEYFAQLLNFLDHAVEERFLKSAHRDMLIVETTAKSILDAIEAYEPAYGDKWL